jgi:hypothetical protein
VNRSSSSKTEPASPPRFIETDHDLVVQRPEQEQVFEDVR